MAFILDNKETILSVIYGWRGKLTYDLLSKELQIKLSLKSPPSRHTYLKHPEIELAFKNKKRELRDNKSQAINEAKMLFDGSDKLSRLLANLDDDDATIAELIKCAEKLERENERLLSENNTLKKQVGNVLETFTRWQYNLQRMDGVDLYKLQKNIDQGLPAKNRD